MIPMLVDKKRFVALDIYEKLAVVVDVKPWVRLKVGVVIKLILLAFN